MQVKSEKQRKTQETHATLRVCEQEECQTPPSHII